MYSVAVAVVAAVLVPVSASSTNIGGAQPLTVRKSESIGVSPWMAPPVLVSRDPFVPGNRWAEDPAPRVVPNAVRAITAPTVLVKAIVIGPHPLALLDEAGVMRIVGLGDAIGAARVSSISADQIVLSTGATLMISPL